MAERTYANEGRLVAALIRRIQSDPRPSHARKVHGSQYQTGQPDIDACVSGIAVKIEVKMPGREPTPLQAKRLREWEDAGAVVGCVHSMAELEELLRRIP